MKPVLFLLIAVVLHAEPWWGYRLATTKPNSAGCRAYQEPLTLYNALVGAGLSEGLVMNNFPDISWDKMIAAVAIRPAGRLGMPNGFLSYQGSPASALLTFTTSTDTTPGIIVLGLLRRSTPSKLCEIREQASSSSLPQVLVSVTTTSKGSGKADSPISQGDPARFQTLKEKPRSLAVQKLVEKSFHKGVSKTVQSDKQ